MVPMALEGCACRAAFHVGVATWMSERGRMPSVLAGASSGSVVAALWCAGEIDAMRDLWLELAGTTVVFEPRRLLRGGWPGRMSHVLGEPLKRFEHLKMSEFPNLRIVVTRMGLRGPRPVVLDASSGVSVVKAVLASCFIPGPYSRPVVIDGRFAVDGAWAERVPLRALPAGPCVAVTTDVRGRLLQGWPFERAQEVSNEVKVLSPIRELPLAGFDFDEEGTRESIRIGVESADAFFRRYDRWLDRADARL